MTTELTRGPYTHPSYHTYHFANQIINDDERYAAGSFGQLILRSAFQPILQASRYGKIIGYEALLRAVTAQNVPVSPMEAFSSVADAQVLVQLDRLCRTVHVENFLRQHGRGLLFLNVHPRSLIRLSSDAGHAFKQILDQYGINTENIVIEVLEGAITNESLLLDAVNSYRSYGYKVAVDDFGAGYSNFQRIWRLSPDIVKLDRSMIVEAASNIKIRRVLPKLVSILHDVGSSVVLEGIETESQAEIALEAKVDFLQGYYFSRPGSEIAAIKRQATERATKFDWSASWDI